MTAGRVKTWFASNVLIASVLSLPLLGCQAASPTYVPDAAGAESTSAIGMTCSSPVRLTQDCSSWSGATREIELDTVRLKIAGSSDGRTVFMMGPKPNANTLRGTHSQTTNVGYELVKRRLVAQGIAIQGVKPVASTGSLLGYLIDTDSDSYAVLKTHSVK